jgi:GntR family transcriptional regulator
LLLDQSSSQPLFQQLQDRIREQIAKGELKPGDRIASEVVLARACGISRMTVRRAIDELVDEGVLYRQQSKGTYVAGLFARSQGLVSLSFSQYVRSLGFGQHDQYLVRGLASVPVSAARDLGLAPGSQAVCIRRVRHVEGHPVMVETSWLPRRFEAVPAADLEHRSLHTVMEEVSRLRLVHSDEFMWVGKASPEDAFLLGITPGDPVYLERGVVQAEGAVPVRSTELVMRNDFFRFSLSGGGGLQMRSPRTPLGDANTEWLAMKWWSKR